ncbi:MAG: hypothetical protein JNL60_18340 [Bacteroidia bacterium]|nr:hypothetical protein [Bacteroidia bacterium]
MEEQNLQREESWKEGEERWQKFEKAQRRGKIMGGLLIVAIGALFLGRELGYEIPVWIFTWKVLLIGIGLVIAIKHKFLHPAWIVLVAVGGVFLITDLYPEMNIKPILWPILIIVVGLIIIFKPRYGHRDRMHYRRHWHNKWHQHHGRKHHEAYQRLQEKFEEKAYKDAYRNFEERVEPSKEDVIESIVFMAGVKKNILSKNFKGGDVTSIFGGTELNLSQADFEGSINLEVTQVFGGTKLIVPANWEIKSELVTVFGSVEDKRALQPTIETEPRKVLVLTGTTVLGGIEIRNY